jgi:hypothetical protein
MAIFVNYYPCSYGDSLVSMFNGTRKKRYKNIVVLNSKSFWLKHLDFYKATSEQQQQLLSQLGTSSIIGIHRQYQFDFGHSHKVISIVLDHAPWFAARFQAVHIDQKKKNLSNLKLLQLQHKIPMHDLICHDYQQWAKVNILDTDVQLPFSLLKNPAQFKEFCTLHGLKYFQSAVDEILHNTLQYNDPH